MFKSLLTLSLLTLGSAAPAPAPPALSNVYPDGAPPPPGLPRPGPPHGGGPPPPGPPPPPPAPGRPGQVFPFFENSTVFTPPASWTDHSTSYARNVLLNQNCEKNNVLLSSWAQSPPNGPYLPISRSTDGGKTWAEISQLYFTNRDYSGGIILQPFLFELPKAYGKYPAGTVLGTGNAIPATFDSTNIELYASLDKGMTWEFVSVVATGSGPNTTNGAHPVWEPFIMDYQDDIVVYYSDQRDPLHGQKLAHQTSTDLVNWGPVVNDIAYTNYTLRPGMTTVAKLGNGQYMLSYELAFAPEDPVKAPYAVHYVLADNPLEFASAPYNLLKSSTDGIIPSAGPYTVWTPAGGPKGTIVVSDSSYDQLFLNTEYGDPAHWVTVNSGHGVGYTRALRVMPGDESTILLQNGGMYGQNYTEVTAGDFLVPGPPGPPGFDTISACNGKGWALSK